MKKIAILSIAAFIAIPFISFGQNETTPPKPLKRIMIKDVFIQSLKYNDNNNYGSFQDFQKISPNSSILNNANTANLTSYNNNYYENGYGYGYGYGLGNRFGRIYSGNSISASLGIQFSDKERKSYKSNPLLRLGLSYNSSNILSITANSSRRAASDTLTSNQNGNQVFIDSIISDSYFMNYSSQQLKLEGSLIFRTNPSARWSLYSGIGFSLGFSINSYSGISYSQNTTLESRMSNGNTGTTYFNNVPNVNYNSTSEYFRNKRDYSASLYIPIGIDFRIGDKNEFWKKMHIFYEIRAGVNNTKIQELRKFTNVGIQHGFGIRYSW